MQKHLPIGRGAKILDQKTEGGFNEPPPPLASLKVKESYRGSSTRIPNYSAQLFPFAAQIHDKAEKFFRLPRQKTNLPKKSFTPS